MRRRRRSSEEPGFSNGDAPAQGRDRIRNRSPAPAPAKASPRRTRAIPPIGRAGQRACHNRHRFGRPERDDKVQQTREDKADIHDEHGVAAPAALARSAHMIMMHDPEAPMIAAATRLSAPPAIELWPSRNEATGKSAVDAVAAKGAPRRMAGFSASEPMVFANTAMITNASAWHQELHSQTSRAMWGASGMSKNIVRLYPVKSVHVQKARCRSPGRQEHATYFAVQADRAYATARTFPASSLPRANPSCFIIRLSARSPSPPR